MAAREAALPATGPASWRARRGRSQASSPTSNGRSVCSRTQWTVSGVSPVKKGSGEASPHPVSPSSVSS
jgi:hypothetical protein